MVMRRAQRAFNGGVISPELQGRTDLEKFGYALSDALNALALREGGAAGRAGTEFVGEVADSSKSTRLSKFQFGVEQIYVHEWGDEVLRVTMDGAHVLEDAQAFTALSDASPGVFTRVAHGYNTGEQVFLSGITSPADLAAALNNRHYRVVKDSDDTLHLLDMFGAAINTTPYAAWIAGGTLARVYQLETPYGHAHVAGLCMAQSNDNQYVTSLLYPVQKLTRQAHDDWEIAAVSFQASIVAPTGFAGTPDTSGGVTIARDYIYAVTGHSDDVSEESLPSASITLSNDLDVGGNQNDLEWDDMGYDRYSIYKDDNGILGYIGGTSGITFTDNNIDPDLAYTPPGARNPFAAPGDYPGVAEFHEGRLVFGCTLNEPGGLWFSGSEKYENMNVSRPARSDDAITLRLRPGVNPVRGLSSGKVLGVFTADAEFTIKGSNVVGFITPASIDVKRETFFGSHALRPLALDDGIVLHAQRQGRVVRAFGYSFEKDGYKSNNLTLLAPHLFRGRRIVSWDYLQDPYSVVLCAMSDGALLSLTFLPDQNVFAWMPHRLAGSYQGGAAQVMDVICTEGEEEDEATLLVRRTINGQTKQYMERLKSLEWGEDIADYWGLDCALRYEGAPTNRITGLHHLTGQTVAALADGWLIEDLVVSADGSVTLDDDPDVKFSKVLIGLQPEAPYLTPLPVSEETRQGASEGRNIRVTGVALSLLRTLGLSIGAADDKMVPVRNAPSMDWGAPPAPVTGITDMTKILPAWSKEGLCKIKGTGGLPFHVRGVYADITVVK